MIVSERRTFFGILTALFLSLLMPAAFAAAPATGTITPSSGTVTSNTAQKFTCIYSDADGWKNLKNAFLLISTSETTLANSVYVYYSQNNNLLYLRDNANSAWKGGFAPGSANVIENAQVKLDCASTSVSGSGSTLTVKFSLTFKPAYSVKPYNSYLKAVDDNSNLDDWEKKGTIFIFRKPLGPP